MLKAREVGAGKVAQWLEALAALSEDLGLIHSTWVVVHSC